MSNFDQSANVQLYGYNPTGWLSLDYTVLYAVSTILHLIPAIYFKLWFLLPTVVVCGAAEIIGWSCRYWAYRNPNTDINTSKTPFIAQIVTTLVGPTFLLAAIFIILGRLIRALGPQYSRLGPKKYLMIFTALDVSALLIQIAGGTIASAQLSQNKSAALGGHIMLTGIAFQLAAITFYIVFSTEFFLRVAYQRPVSAKSPPKEVSSNASSTESADRTRPFINSNLALASIGLNIAIFFIFVRAIYRTIELSQGFDGKIINTQIYFNVLDGLMILLALVTLNAFHPVLILKGDENAQRAQAARCRVMDMSSKA